MHMNGFKGEARPLDEIDVAKLAYRIAVSEAHFQAFLNVESRSRGFDRQGRPIILTEPHVFYRNLSGMDREAAVAEGLAYPRWGEKPYPATQADRYIWLHKACDINMDAALMSCSWGASQVLGENYSMVGYSSVKSMVQAFMDDEEEHIEAMMKYVLATGIDDDLRHERWDTVARVYNGPGYRENGYHTKMEREFEKLIREPLSGWQPPEDRPGSSTVADKVTIESVQRRLRELGYFEVGKVDGFWGTKTRAAVLGFRDDVGLPLVADIDQELLSALMIAQERDVSLERASTTEADVRATGSRQIATSDQQQVGGALLTGGGLLAGVTDALGIEEGETFTQVWGAVQPIVNLIESYGAYMLVGVGCWIAYQAYLNKKARVEDERQGKHVGRG